MSQVNLRNNWMPIAGMTGQTRITTIFWAWSIAAVVGDFMSVHKYILRVDGR